MRKLIVAAVLVAALTGCAGNPDYSDVPYSETPSGQLLNLGGQLLENSSPRLGTTTTCMPFMGGFNCNSY
jgi:hypothetical protein